MRGGGGVGGGGERRLLKIEADTLGTLQMLTAGPRSAIGRAPDS